VLEWREPGPPAGDEAGVVSQVRVFRGAAAVKAFVSQRGFARVAAIEFRLTERKGAVAVASVITSRAAILGWDERLYALPAPLTASLWMRDLDRLGALAQVRRQLTEALAQAVAARLLTHGASQQVRALFEALIGSSDRP
jgi:hypothetical protein